MIADTHTRQALVLLVDDVMQAIGAMYCSGDLDALSNLCVPYLSGFGTAAHERCHRWDDMALFVPTSPESFLEAFEIRIKEHEVFRVGDVAWLYGESYGRIRTGDGWIDVPSMRATFVFSRGGESAAWKVAHIHWSFPDTTPEDAYFDIDGLQNYSRELEQKVEQRTAELREKKAQVEEALAKLHAAQHQLVQQEKMASLGRLTAGIAHEIKNPLNFVNNFAALVEELAGEMVEAVESDDREAVRVAAEDLKLNARKIVEHGRRADGIVRSMLEHSRGVEGERREVDLNRLVDEYVDLAYHGMRAQTSDFTVTLEKQFDPDLGSVVVAPQEIGRVVLNLLNNAFHAVDNYASSAGEEYAPAVTVRTAAMGSDVFIRVEDNGAGVPSELLDKIFEPFFTTKSPGEGTGLGLSMSYDIISNVHDGALEVHNAADGGAVFEIRIPRNSKD